MAARVAMAATTVALISGCGPKRIALPSGDGTPYDASTAYEQAIQECRGARTIEVTLGLSGRAGDMRLRGNVDAGFEAPDKVRLEMRAPIGRPIFILAAPGLESTLYLPRDNRVLRSARTAEVVEALVGLPLDGGQLRSIVSGCAFGAGQSADGRTFPGGWVTAGVEGARTYLRQIEGRWRIVAAVKGELTVHYSTFESGRATELRLQAPASRADVSARLIDMNVNVPLQPAVFQLKLPADADPMTLGELRRAGPLGGQ